MPRQSERWSSVGNGCAFALILLYGCARESSELLLTQEDLAQPGRIVAWLEQHADAASDPAAATWFEQGRAAEAAGNWSKAVKAYGESALRYPASSTLLRHADVSVVAIAAVRARAGTAGVAKQELAAIRDLYRSVVAADAIVHRLSPEDAMAAAHAVACLSAFVESGADDGNCLPLTRYQQTNR